MDKTELRRYIRKEKELYSEEEKNSMSHRICRQLSMHPQIEAASVVLLYWALPDEVRMEELAQELVGRGRTVLLPKVVSETEMTVHRFTSIADLAEGAYGIQEPTGPVVDIDTLGDEHMVAVVPGMAFDKEGHRLGRGKGYYDRFLERAVRFYRIGVCFPFQLLPDIPVEQQDVTMNEVVC